MADRNVNYRLECDALGGTIPPLRRAHLVEALNEPYVLGVDCVLSDPTLDVSELLGKNAVLEIDRAHDTTRRVCGIIREVREADMHDGPATRLTMAPALAMLALRRNTRIFQGKTAPEIVQRVLTEGLGAYGRQVSLELNGSYPTREYCVQYQESDLDFVHRLMEEEGISYGFDHEGDVERMILRDRNGSFPALASGAQVAYQPNDLELHGSEPVVHFVRRHRPTVTSVAVRDWDWTQGGSMIVHGEVVGDGPDGRERESYEHGRGRSLTIWSYDHGVRRYQQKDTAAQAPRRREAHRVDERVGVGIGRVISMQPGVTFELSGHPGLEMDGQYLITRVEHVSDVLGSAIPGAGSADPYFNRFECVPVATPYRPKRRTKKPFIASIQTAVVTGPSGEEIHVDEHGRIKVQFHWDREGHDDEHSSCWVRVQQPWAGAGWGFWWVPRIGMEAVVHFVDGDPDRPLVTASVYNGANPTPYPLPDEKTKSTIKSNSSLGGGGFNEFRFEDKSGSEEIFTHAQKDYNEVVEHDHNTLVHHDQSNTVGNDQTQTIGANQTETVHANQMLTVDVNRTVHVKSNFDETVDGTETRHVKGNVTETFDANEHRTISSNVTETIRGNETRTIGGKQTETISGNHAQTISGSATETITGSLTETVNGGITTTTPAAYDVSAVGGLTMTAQGGIKLNAPGGFTMLAPGGVHRIDSFMDWKGVQQLKYGVIKMEQQDITIEVKYFAMGITGAKFEDTVITYANEGIKVWQETLGIKGPAIKMKMGAVENDSKMTVKAP